MFIHGTFTPHPPEAKQFKNGSVTRTCAPMHAIRVTSPETKSRTARAVSAHAPETKHMVRRRQSLFHLLTIGPPETHQSAQLLRRAVDASH